MGDYVITFCQCLWQGKFQNAFGNLENVMSIVIQLKDQPKQSVACHSYYPEMRKAQTTVQNPFEILFL